MTVLHDLATPVAAARGRGLTKIYGQGDTRVALDAVDVTFERGHFTAIMGPSGSGKSTLMHCMAGLDSLTDGDAAIGDTAMLQVAAASEALGQVCLEVVGRRLVERPSR